MQKNVRLIAAFRQNIGGRWYLAGQEFELYESDAADMVAANFATLAPEQPEAQASTYRRRDMRAQK